MPTFDEIEDRVLAALWVDSHGPARLLTGDDLLRNYGVRVEPKWLDSIAATFKQADSVEVYGDKDGTAINLSSLGYRAGHQAALRVSGGTEINVDFAQKRISGDGTKIERFPAGPGWDFFRYEPSAPTTPTIGTTLTPLEAAFLVGAYVITGGNTQQRLEARAITKRFEFGEQPVGWIFDLTRELGSLGFISPTPRDGDEEDQFVQMTDAGVQRAQELFGAGQAPTRKGAMGLRDCVTLDHADDEYQQIREQLHSLRNAVRGDNTIPDQATAIAKMDLAVSLWDQTSIIVRDYKIGLLMYVDDLCEHAATAYYGALAAGLATALKTFAKDKLHIDLSTLGF